MLGSFSTIQKAGKQAKAQGQFALMGSLARVILPVLSGYVEQYIEPTGSFALVQFMMGLSLSAVLCMLNRIVYFTEQGQKASGGAAGMWGVKCVNLVPVECMVDGAVQFNPVDNIFI